MHKVKIKPYKNNICGEGKAEEEKQISYNQKVQPARKKLKQNNQTGTRTNQQKTSKKQQDKRNLKKYI